MPLFLASFPSTFVQSVHTCYYTSREQTCHIEIQVVVLHIRHILLLVRLFHLKLPLLSSFFFLLLGFHEQAKHLHLLSSLVSLCLAHASFLVMMCSIFSAILVAFPSNFSFSHFLPLYLATRVVGASPPFAPSIGSPPSSLALVLAVLKKWWNIASLTLRIRLVPTMHHLEWIALGVVIQSGRPGKARQWHDQTSCNIRAAPTAPIKELFVKVDFPMNQSFFTDTEKCWRCSRMRAVAFMTENQRFGTGTTGGCQMRGLYLNFGPIYKISNVKMFRPDLMSPGGA